MQYPQLTEYVKAITDSADNLDKLSHLRPVKDNQGEPLRSVGGFAVVFKMQDEDTGRMYALKCFHEDQNGREQSYEAISQTLRKIHSPYLMEVEYLSNELFVDTIMSDETEYPVLKMDWVEGETMESYIATHFRDTAAIKRLYEKFCDLALWLRTQSFAHGDIKPDNIMIKTDGSLIMVDYDGMFVPSLVGKPSPTIGTKGFSHPFRTDKDFDENIDDFALASMSISLLAMSEDSTLFQDYSKPDRLLFSYEDYQDLENSSIYKKLKGMGGLFPKLLDLFAQCLKTNEPNTKTYDKIFDLQTKAPEIISFANKNGKQIYEGDEVILSWEVENATQTFINDNEIIGKNEYKFKAKETKTFEIKASNGLKEASDILEVEVLPQATISLKSNLVKLRKGKDTMVHLSWKVKNAKSAILFVGSQEKKIKAIGDAEAKIDQSTVIRIEATGLDGIRKFNKQLHVNIFSESEVLFAADKYYSLPNIPIKLTWDIKHAKEIELVGTGKVANIGELIVEPKETSTYVLKVTDAFGTKEHSLEIQMLPIPHVKALNIPTPQFNNSTEVKITIPPPNLQRIFPNINVMGVEFNAPLAPEFSEIELDKEFAKRIGKQVGIWADIKSIYSYYRNKLLRHER